MSKTENPFVMKILSTGTGPGGEFISSGCVPDGRQGCDTTPLHNTIMRDPDVEVTDPNPIEFSWDVFPTAGFERNWLNPPDPRVRKIAPNFAPL
ncbi:hypothetical protein MTP99_007447 [Tenebrio molitor]|jgi:hypothetical protein|nr:hypothetical protein MTP99_007447 [Tenebrio molitor]